MNSHITILRSLARRKPLRAFAIALVFYLATPFPPAPWTTNVAAQTFTHNTTTLSSAQALADTTAVLTAVSAATGSTFGAVAVGQYLYVDQELELITAVSSTTVTVQRPPAKRAAHAAGAAVYIGSGSAFQRVDPPPGTCTTANQPKFWINVDTGSMFTCGANSVWAKGTTPWYTPFNSGNGATVTITAAQAGQTFLFDRAAGIVYTLPAPVPGMTFDFIQTVTTTSNSAEIATSAGTVFIQGLVHIGISGGATGSDWQCNGTSHVAVKQNGTTTGGILGGRLHFVAVSSTVWQVDGLTIGSGTEATPCSASV